MRFVNEELGVTIDVPDKITVKKHLEYQGAALIASGQDLFVRFWEGAKAIGIEMDCAYFKLADNLDEIECGTETADKINRLVRWVGLTVWTHIKEITSLPKNS